MKPRRHNKLNKPRLTSMTNKNKRSTMPRLTQINSTLISQQLELLLKVSEQIANLAGMQQRERMLAVLLKKLLIYLQNQQELRKHKIRRVLTSLPHSHKPISNLSKLKIDKEPRLLSNKKQLFLMMLSQMPIDIDNLPASSEPESRDSKLKSRKKEKTKNLLNYQQATRLPSQRLTPWLKSQLPIFNTSEKKTARLKIKLKMKLTTKDLPKVKPRLPN